MTVPLPVPPATAGRAYFGLQAAAAAVWWGLVFTVDPVRTATLGALNPVLVGAFDVPLFGVASLLAALGFRWALWVIWPWTLLVTVAMAGYATVTGLAGWGAVAMIAAAGGTTVAALLILQGRIPTQLAFVGPFRFRPAETASSGCYVARTGAQVVFFWGFFLVVAPLALTALEARWGLALPLPGWIRIAGAVLLAAASALGVWSALAMSTRGEGTPFPSTTARKLVVSGPYRLVRNPMAVAGVAQGVAVGLLFGSWFVIVYAVAGSLLWNWGVRPHEEDDLEARFGDEYRRYVERVNCWLPRRTRR